MDYYPHVTKLFNLFVILGLEFAFFPIALVVPLLLLRWLERRRSRLSLHCRGLCITAREFAARGDQCAALSHLTEIEHLEAKLRNGTRPSAQMGQWAFAVATGILFAAGALVGAELLEVALGDGRNSWNSELKELLSWQSLLWYVLTLLSSLSICHMAGPAVRQPPQIDFSQQLRKALGASRS
jgi:hypothetical protein